MKQKIYITASEIGDFVYCPRGWWLRFHRFLSGKSEQMLEGSKQHESLASSVNRHSLIFLLAIILIILGLLVLFFSQ